MKTLYIHAGQAKTGSTFLQSVFKTSQGRLLENGIVYPDRPPLQNINMLMAGYVDNLMTLPPELAGGIASTADMSLFVSDEEFCNRSVNTPECSKDIILDVAKRHEFSNIKIIAFTRNPVSHCASLIQQGIKSGGLGGDSGLQSIIDRAAIGWRKPAEMDQFLETWQGTPDVELTVRNYTAVRSDLSAILATWLGLQDDGFILPEQTIVNRSMTRGEMAFQVYLNAALGKQAPQVGAEHNSIGGKSPPRQGMGPRLGTELCRTVPDVKRDPLYPTLAAQEKMLELMAPHIERVNAQLEPDDQYQIDLRPDPEGQDDNYEFTGEQLDVSARFLSDFLMSLSSDAPRRVGDLCFRNKDLEEAIEHYLQAIDLYRGNGAAHHGLARTYKQLGQIKNAVRSAEEAVGVFPNKSVFRLTLAACRIGSGDLHGAESEYRDLIQLYPQNPAAHFELSLLLETSDKSEEALTEASLAATLAPSNKRMKNHYDSLTEKYNKAAVGA